ncbi:Nif3-like dinuclear metal center hexameric protein [Aestuariibacter halophilus]|uniref:Nif3-like dinuclear metal center hexameric protein n=1 Tax=Fluctibacter halophilus TaxID=226011 RepID=A0ABS8G4M7_9ALTE|nr:Nif3-like dinuclear metal center hexameric protein [Aestuariibacter halophilus]
MTNLQLETYLNDFLQSDKVRDYCPNGLQVEGRQSVQRMVTGVTATEALIDAAIEHQADTVLVHHGYFWKGENAQIRGMKQRRLKKLLSHDINLLAYHLPLDVHPDVGNNAELAKRLGIAVQGGLEVGNPFSVAMYGEFTTPYANLASLGQHIETVLERSPMLIEGHDRPIKRVGWCTGGGQNYIELAANAGLDVFISGEISEQTVHTAREMGIHFVAAGHHATERYGAKALGEHLAEYFGLDVTFVDIDNPA